MAQEPRKLRKLLEILTEFNVTHYKEKEVEVSIAPPPISPDLGMVNKLYGDALTEVDENLVAKPPFSIDNYVNSTDVNIRSKGNGGESLDTVDGYSEDEMLFWSADQ